MKDSTMAALAVTGIVVLLAGGGLSHFKAWVQRWAAGLPDTTGTNPLPDAGGPGTPNAPVAAGTAGTGTNGQPSTANGPAAGSPLFGTLFPNQQKGGGGDGVAAGEAARSSYNANQRGDSYGGAPHLRTY